MTSQLRVERRIDPIGLDSPQPRFAWRPAAMQVAYQLQVVDAEDAGSWTSPTWDTGRRASSESTYVPYQGPSLQARHRYTWRVRVSTPDDAEGTWSDPASFEMGLLAP